MAVIKKHKDGEFSWADLGTKDPAGAKIFYRAIFGWTVKDFPMGPGQKYSIMRVRGKDACALYPMQPEQRKMKAPPSWLPYISVKNVDASVKKAKAAGGKLCMGPMDVMDKGRMAMLQDPTGAGFAIWQARKHKGAELDGTPGTIVWHDLNTPKPKVAGKFYAKAFGWKVDDQTFGGGTYHLFKLGKEGICGMWPFPMKKLPPSWLTYWQVASCAKTVAKAKRLGAKALMDPMEVPEMCRFAVLKDPQGAAFGVLEPLM